MDFAFNTDQQLLRNAARAFLDQQCPAAVVRGLMDDPHGASDAIWKEMARLGWLGLALPEEHGGSGLGMVETAIVLEELGRAACPSPYLPTVLAGFLIARAGTSAQHARWLPAIATGTARATVAFLDRDLAWAPDAVRTEATPADGGVALTGEKSFVPWAHVADVIVVPARTSAGVSLFLAESGARGITFAPLPAMDLGTRWATVRFDRTPIPASATLGEPGQGGALLAWLLQRAAVGAAGEMLGAARRCLDMAVGYVKVREQFGQPIGAFQAIRHKCADMLLEVENAHAATYYAAWALDAEADDAAVAASVAKAYVGDAARKVCGDAIQVHGGIGFTWEYDLHLYVKRAKALEAMYGDSDYHRELIVRQVAG